jgi:putative transposase
LLSAADWSTSGQLWEARVKQVVQLKLIPVGDHAAALAATLETCNQAANEVSEVAFARGVFRDDSLRRLVYGSVRARGLGAQAAQHVIKKVADAYTTLHANLRNGNLGRPGSKRYEKAAGTPIRFRPQAAQPFDQRNLSFDLDAQTISIWTVGGRVKPIPYVGSPEALKLLASCPRGEADLLCRDGMWLLHVTVEMPEEPLNTTPAGWLGVDLGIVNIATTSDGTIHAGWGLNRHRRRQLQLRHKLQAKKTKSAKRVLKRQRRKEARRARDVNHRISKRIVAEAERTERGIALEDLTGIRGRARLRKPQRAMLHSWAFAQLGSFIAYKARRSGVPVVYVDPAYTSRTCADCGHVDKRNRVSQAWFICRSCGVVAHADRNGSRNIAHRAGVVWDAGRQSSAPAA